MNKIPIRYLHHLKRLRKLTVEFKHGAQLERGTFRKLGRVTSLRIVGSNLESIHASAFLGLKNLKELSIWDTSITGNLLLLLLLLLLLSSLLLLFLLLLVVLLLLGGIIPENVT